MTDEIRRLVTGLKMWKDNLFDERDKITDELLMRVNTLNQDTLTAAIAYIEAGEKEMPELPSMVAHHSMVCYEIVKRKKGMCSCGADDFNKLWDETLGKITPIIARLTSEREKAEREIVAWKGENQIHINHDLRQKHTIDNLEKERDALQAKLDAVMDVMRRVSNDLGAPTMDYAPEAKITELEVRIQKLSTAINAAITGEGR